MMGWSLEELDFLCEDDFSLDALGVSWDGRRTDGRADDLLTSSSEISSGSLTGGGGAKGALVAGGGVGTIGVYNLETPSVYVCERPKEARKGLVPDLLRY